MRILLPLFALLLISISLNAQERSIEYLENSLIIKFKSEQDVANFKSKSIAQPTLFIEHNVEILNSIWKNEYDTKINLRMQSRGKVIEPSIIDRLKNIHYVSFDSDVDALELANEISNLPEVEYAEPRYIYQTGLVTNDPIENDFVEFHNFDQAWELVSNTEDIIISIVDSGVNYDHEDLRGKQWLNEDEIPNNGIDDDGNGFVDDYLGWDFVDIDENGSRTEDNDPFGTFSSHGTHVAGIATATPNNGLGLVGAGYNARYMAVKVGGLQDDPSTSNDESRAIQAGYEGILYSIINGADIINCSWGGAGIASQFQQDIIDLGRDSGSLIVVSAGNAASDAENYPADYENVLSVGALGSGNVIASYSSFGAEVDVFAKGTIRSSVGTTPNQYATFSGTSMSSPVVAGLAALVKAKYPNFTPEQIENQIKNSSISIEPDNITSLQSKLGSGKINALTAVGPPQPNIFIRSEEYLNSEGDDLGISENGTLSITLSNSGGTTTNLSATINSLSENIIIPSTSILIGEIVNDGQRTIEVPILLNEGILESLTGEISIDLVDNTLDYNASEILIFDRLLYRVSNVNNLALSFSGNGNIGFYDAENSSGGIGFVPNHQTADFFKANLLYEGGIILGANNKIISNVRGLEEEPYDQDFDPIEFYSIKTPGDISDSDGRAVFTSSDTSSIENVRITLNTYAYEDPSTSNSIILNYILENVSPTLALSEVYFGIFNDWNIGDPSNNSTSYNSINDILVIEESGLSEYPKTALATFGNTSSVLAINNNYQGANSNFRFNINDGFTINEKNNSIKSGVRNTNIFKTDVSAVVATGPYFIPPRSSVSLGFVYAFGDSEEELVDQINAARDLNIFEITEMNSNSQNSFPNETALFQNYPNPFNPSTTFSFGIDGSENVTLSVYNLLGQKVRTVVNSKLEAGIHNYTVSMNDLGSGVYFAILETPQKRELIKLTLIK